MEIPNYGSGNSLKKISSKYIHICQTIHLECYFVVIQALVRLTFYVTCCPLIYYDQIYLYAKNLEQEKYKNMIERMNEFSQNVGYNVLVYNNDNIIPMII